MFKRNKLGYYEFEELKRFKGPLSGQGLIHGFSTREFGDCREKVAKNWKNIEKFLSALGLRKENLVLVKQVHKDKIKVARSEDGGKIISGVDGLLTDKRGVVLGVRTADCLPILFYEPKAKIIGLAHAGWRGVLLRLPQKMIDQIIKIGGLPERILIAIGPHICQKCYKVDKNRTVQFLTQFGELKKMISEENLLDLEIPSKNQLLHSGVLLKNIFSANICTSCQSKEFFSYRKDSKQSYGAILGVISLIN